jgi:hypothetical protein
MRIDPSEGHPAMDYSEHERTYKLFLKGTIVVIVTVIAIMGFMAIFVA